MIHSVSVLTPSYNDGRFLPECIASAQEAAAAAGLPVQHIVTDDGSTDDTTAALAAWPSVTAVRLPENRGTSAALNAALGLATADWCLILAADDMVMPAAFLDWSQAALAHPDANVIYADLELCGTRHGRYGVAAFRPLLMRERNILPGASFIRRSLLMAVGGFDESMRTAQDWDFWVRAELVVGLQVVKLPAPLVRYRFHEGQRLHNESARNIAQIRAYIQTRIPENAVLTLRGVA